MAPTDKKTFIVTGASRGLGLAIVEILLRASHNVFLVARSEASMAQVKEQNKDSVDYLAADFGDLSVGPSIVQAAIKAFGKIDGIVVNHGVLDPLTKIAGSDTEAWRKSYDINFFSAVGLMSAAIPELRKTKGRVVFTSSGAAGNGIAAWGCYGSSKAAMNHLTLQLSAEEPDITFVAISPGKVDTDMQKQIREAGKGHMADAVHASFVNEHESGKLLKPEQPGTVMANLVVEAPKEFSGKHFRWNETEMSKFQQ